jgi:hypothetical protein
MLILRTSLPSSNQRSAVRQIAAPLSFVIHCRMPSRSAMTSHGTEDGASATIRSARSDSRSPDTRAVAAENALSNFAPRSFATTCRACNNRSFIVMMTPNVKSRPKRPLMGLLVTCRIGQNPLINTDLWPLVLVTMTNKTFAGKPPAQAAAESHARRRAGELASPQTCMIDLPGVPLGVRVCGHRPAEPIAMRLCGQDTIHPSTAASA